MSEVKLSTKVSSALKEISAQIEEMESVAKDVSTAHSKLLWDDVFAFFDSYSKGIVSGIGTAAGDLKKMKNRLSSCCTSANNAVSGLFEADENSGGHQTGRSSQAKPSKNWLKWMIASTVPGGLFTYTVISSIVGPLFGGSSENTSTEVVTISKWDGKQVVEEKSKAVHSYYEAVLTDHVQYMEDHYKLSVAYYSDGVQKGRIRFVSQNSDLSNNGWGSYTGIAGGECGYASQSMALSYIGKDVPPGQLCAEEASGIHQTEYGNPYVSGVHCASGSGNISASDAPSILSKMLDDFTNDFGKGKVSPIVLHYGGNRGPHAIVITGKNADGSYAVIDTARGNTVLSCTISDSGYVSGDSYFTHGGGYIDGIQQFIADE